MNYEKSGTASNSQIKQEGFTLIEVLICIGIFAIGFLAVAGLQTKVMRVDTNSRLLTDAYKVATDQVEEIMLWDYSDAGLTPNDTEDEDLTNDSYDLGGRGAGNRYKLSYVVAEDPLMPMKAVTVQVEIAVSKLPPVEIEFLKAPIQNIHN